MRIVVLDGYTLNPGDLNWGRLEALGDCVIYERTDPCEIIHRSKDADVIFTNKTVLDREVLTALPKLCYIGVLATGYDVVDMATAKDRNIIVTHVPTYGTRSVAQHVLALLLELTQHVGHHAAAVRQGRWSSSPDFCFWDYPLIELEGLTMGIIGFGRIGRTVADLAGALGMSVMVYDVCTPQALPPFAQPTDLDTLLIQSDAVSLHCPLTEDNQGFIDAARLAMMKPSAFLINTSRGPLVNEQDLAAALNAERIAGAGLDVLSIEPPQADTPLLRAKNCYITPHVAWATHAARTRLMHIATENLLAFLNGQAVNTVH